jgi:hypothetical protein
MNLREEFKQEANTEPIGNAFEWNDDRCVAHLDYVEWLEDKINKHSEIDCPHCQSNVVWECGIYRKCGECGKLWWYHD